jgi:hypothetical protein
MIYELREYTVIPGRMPELVKRFNDYTLRLFKKHNIDCVFCSLTAIGENSHNELIYVVRFESSADRDEKWATFVADPEWVEALELSEKAAGGPLVSSIRNRILSPAAFV